MPMNYAYHPGNVAHSSAQEVADTVLPAVKTLGINLIPLDGATSCGGGIIRQANRRLQLTLNARTFAMAEEAGLDVLTHVQPAKEICTKIWLCSFLTRNFVLKSMMFFSEHVE